MTPAGHVFGTPVFLSPCAMIQRQRRRYPKRKAKTPAQWHRMNKKLAKRHGYESWPSMFTMVEPASGRFVIVTHPALLAMLKEGHGRAFPV